MGETGQEPLQLVEVKLFREEGSLVAVAVSDSFGRYRIITPEPGDYWMQADVLGYEGLKTPLLALDEAKTYKVDFELSGDPIELEGLRVEVEAIEEVRRDLRMFGVDPDAMGERFVDIRDIERRETARDFGHVLQWQSIPGMRVIRSDDLAAAEKPLHPFVCVQMAAGRSSCAIVVLNGSRITLEAGHMVPAQSLRAIAVLTPVEATTIYGTGADGGAVLLFTR